MNRPTVAEIRRANKVLEEEEEEEEVTNSKKHYVGFIWKLIILIFILCSLSSLGGINTFLLLGWVGPERIKEWSKFLFH